MRPGAKGALELFKRGQDPKVAGALEQYLMGNISSPERIAAVRERLPIRPITEIPRQYTDQEIIEALMATNGQRHLPRLNLER